MATDLPERAPGSLVILTESINHKRQPLDHGTKKYWLTSKWTLNQRIISEGH